jgi:glycyl-tRNA synthetase beta chain
MSAHDLLVEIGTEELPPKALRSLGLALKSGIESGLQAEGLGFASLTWFATPRRLAVLVDNLATATPDKDIEKYGPAVKAAFDADGNPTPAALGFARSCNVQVDDLEQGEKDGINKLLFRAFEQGQPTEKLIPGIVSTALNKLPIPKRMRWGSSREEFVRPVHWIVMLFGDHIIDASILGKQAGRTTFGHRFHHPEAIEITSPSDYAEQLETVGYVIPAFDARKDKVRDLVQGEAAKLAAQVNIDDALLDEVASLVEWPVALTGQFDEHFLTVPAEALVSSLTAHQKCFHLTNDHGELLPNFIAISNLVSKDPAQVIEGNERVIRPRLADADFFFQTDKKDSLESRQERLKQIVFQQKLGTVYEKSRRVAALSGYIAGQLGGQVVLCERAAMLAKCDLVTNMVGEFADLQGIMGRYYALHDGEDPEVAAALDEQYMPRHAGDALPETLTGNVLSLAEKIDTVVGLFAIGQPPTGSKDPFALRRAAIGILRILVEKQLDLNLQLTIDEALTALSFVDPDPKVGDQVFDFFLDRFRYWYQEKGIPAEVYQSVLALRPGKPLDFDSRVLAVDHFSRLDEARALASANKRVANILADIDGNLDDYSMNESLFREPEENELASLVGEKEREVAPLFENRSYQEGLEKLASLKDPVDRFFDKVMVMDDDTELRNNRIALLIRLRALFLQVADISYLHQA